MLPVGRAKLSQEMKFLYRSVYIVMLVILPGKVSSKYSREILTEQRG